MTERIIQKFRAIRASLKARRSALATPANSAFGENVQLLGSNKHLPLPPAQGELEEVPAIAASYPNHHTYPASWTFSARRSGRGAVARWPLARIRFLALLTLIPCVIAGCTTMGGGSGNKEKDGFFGWHFNAPYDTSEVKTVYVYFKSQSFRRDLEKQLVEAVTKEINLRTPYRVEQDFQKADTVLRGVIISSDKNLLVEAPTNLPRQLSALMNVNVTWTHRIPTEEEKARLPTQIQESYNFVPELGQTTLMAYGQVVESIAKQVVDMMEQPWFLEEDLQ